MKYALLSYLLVISLSGCELLGPGNETTQSSPDGLIEVKFSVFKGNASYAVNYNNNPLLLPSGLGFDIQEQKPLGNNLSIIAVKVK